MQQLKQSAAQADHAAAVAQNQCEQIQEKYSQVKAAYKQQSDQSSALKESLDLEIQVPLFN